MIHAALTLATKIWLCSMTHVRADPQRFIVKIQLKIVGLGQIYMVTKPRRKQKYQNLHYILHKMITEAFKQSRC